MQSIFAAQYPNVVKSISLQTIGCRPADRLKCARLRHWLIHLRLRQQRPVAERSCAHLEMP